jgi:protein ImuB
MSRLYACIISADVKRDKEALISIARQFSYSIEMLDDGILFDVSGLERLIGKPGRIAQKILEELQKQNLSGSIAVAETVDTAALLARQDPARSAQAEACTLNAPDSFQKLPLTDLPIEQDTLNVFSDLGIRKVRDLLEIPRDELVNRYGQDFRDVIDVIEQKGASSLTPNVRENYVSWVYGLDFPVEDFEQLIFILNHGLDRLFEQVSQCGFSTEQLDILFKLRNKTEKAYEIKTSFPTLERTFWLKLMNLRISLDPPEAGIVSVNVVSHFTKPRPSQRGLYAVSRPEPESLLLTVNKLKKLVGEENVGVPVILDQRLAEAFALETDAMPEGNEKIEVRQERSIIAFSYFHPPVQAEVLVRDSRLIFIKTQYFEGRVVEYSGVWKANSKWWDRSWKTQEWDVEIEHTGVYRLCKVGKEWFVAGEYD